MAGVDTVRGIAYQQAQAVIEAIAVLDEPDVAGIRVEGVDDVVDVEVLRLDGTVKRAKQIKTRQEPYTWGNAALKSVVERWAALPAATDADFAFVTDGRLGPTGEEFEAAIEQARKGDLAALRSRLNLSDDALRRAARATIHLDRVPVSALLQRAERQVAALIPDLRSPEELRQSASAAVDALFRELTTRAGNTDADARVIDRREIAELLGVPLDANPDHRWAMVRVGYLDKARQLGLVTVGGLANDSASVPTVTIMDHANDDASSLDVLLNASPTVLAGRTGTGKTTACRALVREAAETDRVVLLAHAEAYLPGHLDALAADAISDVLGVPIPIATGREALNDRKVAIVVDGVSEVPDTIRAALAEDIRVPIAGGRGAQFLLVGRDVAAVREVLPTSRVPATYRVSELDRSNKVHIVRQSLVAFLGSEPAEPQVTQLVAEIDKALGDAAGNPLLFSMAISLRVDGAEIQQRAEMYREFVARMAERYGVTDIVRISLVLGVVSSHLLDEGRRYADPYEWEQLVAQALEQLAITELDAAAMTRAALKAGLVTRLGYTQTIVPIHDSFADYLAGRAIAQGHANLPERLAAFDEQRLLFAAEVGDVSSEMASRCARDLPFLSVRLAAFDHRELSAESPDEIAELLTSLIPGFDAGVRLWSTGDRVVAMLAPGSASAWLSDSQGRDEFDQLPSVVAPGGSGPLNIAVKLWQQWLIDRLHTPSALPPATPRSADEARQALIEFTEACVELMPALIEEVAPPGGRQLLAATVGPAGLIARIETDGPTDDDAFRWPVSYVASESIDVELVLSSEEPFEHRGGRSSVGSLISADPESSSRRRVRNAVKSLVGVHWID